jgi:hypothetical protein
MVLVAQSCAIKPIGGVDPKCEVITATEVTAGSIDDGAMLKKMIDIDENNTQAHVDTVVADSRYGKIDNFLACHDLGINAHIPSLEKTQSRSGRRKGIFPKEVFSYDRASDTFTCPAGQILTRHHYHKGRNHYEYRASPGACAQCRLRDKCTRSKDGRSIKRHARQDDLDSMLKNAGSPRAKKDIKTRQHLSERSFAQSKRHGYKRARWRRLWRMKIQDFLVAAIQNIKILITNTRGKAKAQVNALGVGYYPCKKYPRAPHWPMFNFKTIAINLDTFSNSIEFLTAIPAAY